MIAQKRHRRILEELERRASLSLGQLERLLMASPATIRRDLDFLQKTGLVLRTHGAVHSPKHARGEPSFDRKARAAIEAKHSIAVAAAALVGPGNTVFIDAGSTTLEAGRLLLANKDITIFTNSIPLIEFSAQPEARLISIGGEIRNVSRALVGATALDWLRQLRFSIALLGASGLDSAEGPSTTELSEAAIKSAIAARSDRVVVLADAGKWDRPAAMRFADWSQIHDLITNHPAPRRERERFRKAGTRLHIVGS